MCDVMVIKCVSIVKEPVLIHFDVLLSQSFAGVPRRQPHRRSGLATLPSVGAVP